MNGLKDASLAEVCLAIEKSLCEWVADDTLKTIRNKAKTNGDPASGMGAEYLMHGVSLGPITIRTTDGKFVKAKLMDVSLAVSDFYVGKTGKIILRLSYNEGDWQSFFDCAEVTLRDAQHRFSNLDALKNTLIAIFGDYIQPANLELASNEVAEIAEKEKKKAEDKKAGKFSKYTNNSVLGSW